MVFWIRTASLLQSKFVSAQTFLILCSAMNLCMHRVHYLLQISRAGRRRCVCLRMCLGLAGLNSKSHLLTMNWTRIPSESNAAPDSVSDSEAVTLILMQAKYSSRPIISRLKHHWRELLLLQGTQHLPSHPSATSGLSFY